MFLILDNLRVQHSKPVKAWVAERQDKIELFYLPSYNPELNYKGFPTKVKDEIADGVSLSFS